MLDGTMSVASVHGLPATCRISLAGVVSGAAAMTTALTMMSFAAVTFAAAIAAAATTKQTGVCFIGRFD